ncbi:MAG: adenosine deaminase [Acidimicrobiales bacterium]
MDGLEADLLRLPKVELHVHLEGSFTPGRILALAEAAGEELPDAPSRLLTVDSLPALLARLDWWCGLVRRPEQAEALAHDFASALAGDGVAYAEVIVNPTHWSGLARAALLEAVSAGFARASAEGHTDCWMLVSLLRRQTEEQALGVVHELERRPPGRLVGLSIDGNEAETGPTGRRFAPAFGLAGALGLGRTAHAGESSGPDGVVSALDDLGVSRVDHGIRIVEDGEVLRRVVDDGVPLDVCLTSNLALVYPDLEAHPIRRLVDAGVAVTINTDDPATLGVTLTGELTLATRHLGWGRSGAVAATDRAIDGSFASEATRAALRQALGAYAVR